MKLKKKVKKKRPREWSHVILIPSYLRSLRNNLSIELIPFTSHYSNGPDQINKLLSESISITPADIVTQLVVAV